VRRLLLYAAGVCGALAVAEGAFRVLEPELAASADRVAAKAALLDKQGRVDVLFFGTSRSWDAIAPRQFAAGFPGARAFSVATSAARLEDLEMLTARFSHRPGVRLAFVELSRPQLDGAPQPGPRTSGIEAAAARALKLVAHREALRGESLARLPGLLFFPRRLDGSETRVFDQMAALAGRSPAAAASIGARPLPIAPSAAPPDPRALRLAGVGRAFREAGAEVVFVLPPVRACEPPEDLEAIAAQLARGFRVWDYRAAALPDEAWRDCGHLNARGRALFTRALAEETARAGWMPSMAGRR
jgi:hypothetical protein